MFVCLSVPKDLAKKKLKLDIEYYVYYVRGKFVLNLGCLHGHHLLSVSSYSSRGWDKRNGWEVIILGSYFHFMIIGFPIQVILNQFL